MFFEPTHHFGISPACSEHGFDFNARTGGKGKDSAIMVVASDMSSNSLILESSDTEDHFSSSVLLNAAVVRSAISARRRTSSRKTFVLISGCFCDLCSTVKQHERRSAARTQVPAPATAAAAAETGAEAATTITTATAATAAAATTATAIHYLSFRHRVSQRIQISTD